MSNETEPSRQDLLDLIKWLCLKFGDNEPLFAVETPYGQPLPEGQRRQRTFRAIFGIKDLNPPPVGAWRQCPECRQWYVHHPDSDRTMTDHDAVELVKKMR